MASDVNDFRTIGARYTYDMSKRTKLYTAYTQGSNRGQGTMGLSGAADSTGQVAAGFDPRRFELGMAHSF
jgi:predicted porin